MDETRDETQPADFDTRLEQLEAIVAELERGGLGLEGAIERYQEGIELLKSCQGTLAGYKKRVEELCADADQALRPFGEDPDFDGDDERA